MDYACILECDESISMKFVRILQDKEQCVVERTAIPVRYWKMRVLSFAINDAGDKRYPKDHRIAKAISLTRKYDKNKKSK